MMKVNRELVEQLSTESSEIFDHAAGVAQVWFMKNGAGRESAMEASQIVAAEVLRDFIANRYAYITWQD